MCHICQAIEEDRELVEYNPPEDEYVDESFICGDCGLELHVSDKYAVGDDERPGVCRFCVDGARTRRQWEWCTRPVSAHEREWTW